VRCCRTWLSDDIRQCLFETLSLVCDTAGVGQYFFVSCNLTVEVGGHKIRFLLMVLVMNIGDQIVLWPSIIDNICR
jgi:hypothetical protein